MAITTDDFSEYFQELHGYRPFPWQSRLAKRVLQYGWGNDADPDNEDDGRTDLLALPTAAGKTAVIDIAIFCLAFQGARRVRPRTAPLRIFFVVDRRIVVDEAYDRACRIARKLSDAKDGVLCQVAEALKKPDRAKTPLEDPFQVAVLRGGMYRDDGWAASPIQPVVCVSTVDQVGSRLLFRGYGISEHQRPIHAGLVGCDSLIILDEAHISAPFEETLSAVRRYSSQTWTERGKRPIASPLQVVRMTATPAAGAKPLGINDDDRKNKELMKRLNAKKPAGLIDVKTKAVTQKMPRHERASIGRDNQAAFVSELVEQAERLVRVNAADDTGGEGKSKKKAHGKRQPQRIAPDVPPARVVGVVVNRVATARQVFEKLRELKVEDSSPRYHVILLTGRIRPYDRDELLFRAEVQGQPTGWLRYMRADRNEKKISLDKPLLVVATQTVEVGADLSFDALVTEVASLDALRQRFGRLDRLGRRAVSKAMIVASSDQVSANSDDPVYGKAPRATWLCLSDIASGTKSQREVDFGVLALEASLTKWKRDLPDQVLQNLQRKQKKSKATDEKDLQEKANKIVAERFALLPPRLHAPVMLPAHVDLLCQTSPAPLPDPDVSLFLHGPQSGAADVQIVWRADLPDRLQPNEVANYVATVTLVPPTSLETLSVPVWHVHRWLRELPAAATLTDVEGAMGGEIRDDRVRRSADAQRERRVLLWHGPDDEQTRLIRAKDIRPGDTIVVPADYGGYDPFGWNPNATIQVHDVADPCARLVRWRPVLRLHRLIADTWCRARTELPHGEGSEQTQIPSALARLLESESEESPRGGEFDEALVALRKWPESPGWLTEMAAELMQIGYRSRRSGPTPYPDGKGWLLRAKRRLSRLQIMSDGQPMEPSCEVSTEGDASWRTGAPCPLDLHDKAVGICAEEFAVAAGMPEDIVRVLGLAGGLHDLGKADPRFQIWLHAGDEVAAALADRLLAKSGSHGADRAAVERARVRGGYPKGGRHECLSVKLIEAGGIATLGDSDHDLVAYLIGTHHGRGRPFMPVVPDSTTVQATVQLDGRTLQAPCNHQLYRLDGGWTDRFWAMIRRYGFWGLAYLEAILRLADCSISEQEQQETSR